LLILALVGATPAVKQIANKIMTAQWTESTLGTAAATIVELAVLIALFIISTAFLVDGSFNPFLYFRF
ncbi:MAG: MBOAT family protein, partial [Peptococcaceae bacterium]|nr:MBOAT family protein [Peptococcaceae bacterium]